MKTNKEIESELSKIQDETLLMPKMYSFDEVRKLVKFAIKKTQRELDDLQGAYDIAMKEINRLREVIHKRGYKR